MQSLVCYVMWKRHALSTKRSLILVLREGNMFEDVKKANSFWRELWQTQGTGNKDAAWLQNLEDAIVRRVPPPPEEPWELETSQVVKSLEAPQDTTDLLTAAHTLHNGVTRAFIATSESNKEDLVLVLRG